MSLQVWEKSGRWVGNKRKRVGNCVYVRTSQDWEVEWKRVVSVRNEGVRVRNGAETGGVVTVKNDEVIPCGCLSRVTPAGRCVVRGEGRGGSRSVAGQLQGVCR